MPTVQQRLGRVILSSLVIGAVTVAGCAGAVGTLSPPAPPVAGGAATAPQAPFVPPQMIVDEVKARLETGGVVVVDARFRTDFDESHVPGAISMPLSEIEQRFMELPAGKAIVVYSEVNDCG